VRLYSQDKNSANKLQADETDLKQRRHATFTNETTRQLTARRTIQQV